MVKVTAMSEKKSKKLVPQLRFKGFTNPWEQRKLGEVVTFVGGGTPAKVHPEYWKGDIVWLSSQEVKGGYISSGTYKITEEAVANSATRLVDAYTPLIVSRSGILAHSFPVTLPTKPVAINQDIKALLFDRSHIASDFIVATLQESEYEILTSVVKTGTTVQSVNLPDLKRLAIGIPSLEEQNRVSALFKTLNSLIAAHERKLDLLKKKKAYYLQQTFSQKLRFKGFTEPWQQRKYADFLTESRIVGHSGDTAKKLTVKLWGKGVVEKATTENGSRATQYFVRKSGQLMYGKLDFLHAAFGIVPQSLNNYESTADSPAFDVSSKVSADFVLMSCLRKELYLYQGSTADGSRKAKRVHVPTFLQMELMAPSIEEQNKVSDFFRKIDSLTFVYEYKLGLLNELKQSYLQKMFI
jgi:type I restriction enzyme S subunit